MHNQPSYIASEDIGPSRFVNIVADTDNTIELCDAGDVATAGITAEHSREAPIPSVATPLAAKAGESVQVYGLGEPCEVIAGGTIQAGQRLKPDANAAAVPAVAGDQYSATARTSGVAGEKIKVIVERGSIPV